MSITISEVLSLVDLGFSAVEIRAYAAAPGEASAPVKAARAPKAKPKGNAFYAQVIAARVPCAYGVAKCGFFAPHGVGSTQHTTCAGGRKALAAAR